MQKFLKSKWKLISFIAIAVLLVGGIGLYFKNRTTTGTNQLATVQVSRGPIEVTVSGTGSIAASVTKNITSKVSGPISRINFTNGQTVKKGSLLFEINDDSLQNDIKKAKLELKQAQLNYDASVAASKQSASATTPSQFGQGNSNGYGSSSNSSSKATASNNKASAEVSLQLAKLNLSTLEDQVSDYKIYAPVTGVINLSSSQGSGSSQKLQSLSTSASSSSSSSTTSSDSYYQVGDQVSNNATLATIVGNSGMNVSIPVDEVDINKVKVGQKVTITVDAIPDKTFTGSVKEIANEGTQSNGVASFDVTVAIDKPTGLKIGMTANVEIMVASKNDTLLLPIEAVQERHGRKFVILPNTNNSNTDVGIDTTNNNSSNSGNSPSGTNSNLGQGKQRLANMKVVETGLYNETMIEIKSGLQEGASVVLPDVIKSSTSSNQFGPNGGAGQNSSNRGGFFGENRSSNGSSRGGMGFGGFGRG